MAIYFLRHGESEANAKRIFAGQKDNSPLTPHGFSQAKEAAEEVKKLNIDGIIASPLRRTKQTAEIVAEIIGYNKNQIEFDDRLLEFDMGSLTGSAVGPLTKELLASAKGIEDFKAFRKRILSFLRKYRNNQKNILIVGHAGFGRGLEAARLGLEPEDMYNLVPYPNAKVIKLNLDWMS